LGASQNLDFQNSAGVQIQGVPMIMDWCEAGVYCRFCGLYSEAERRTSNSHIRSVYTHIFVAPKLVPILHEDKLESHILL
jgi:hypothetical protein